MLVENERFSASIFSLFLYILFSLYILTDLHAEAEGEDWAPVQLAYDPSDFLLAVPGRYFLFNVLGPVVQS